MKQLRHEDISKMPPIDIVNAINTGSTIINATFPFIKDLFAKIAELVKSIQTDKLSTPHGKEVAIKELQREVDILNAKDVIIKQQFKLYDAMFEQIKNGTFPTEISIDSLVKAIKKNTSKLSDAVAANTPTA